MTHQNTRVEKNSVQPRTPAIHLSDPVQHTFKTEIGSSLK